MQVGNPSRNLGQLQTLAIEMQMSVSLSLVLAVVSNGSSGAYLSVTSIVLTGSRTRAVPHASRLPYNVIGTRSHVTRDPPGKASVAPKIESSELPFHTVSVFQILARSFELRKKFHFSAGTGWSGQAHQAGMG